MKKDIDYYFIAESFNIDEFLLIIGIFLSFGFLTFVEQSDYDSPLIYCSLFILVIFTGNYTKLFFDTPSLKRLVYFVMMMLTIIFFYATLYKLFGVQTSDIDDPLININWDEAIYFSTVTWTTLGYGDISPIDELHFLASVEAIMGQIFMGLFMGKVLFILQQKHS